MLLCKLSWILWSHEQNRSRIYKSLNDSKNVQVCRGGINRNCLLRQNFIVMPLLYKFPGNKLHIFNSMENMVACKKLVAFKHSWNKFHNLHLSIFQLKSLCKRVAKSGMASFGKCNRNNVGKNKFNCKSCALWKKVKAFSCVKADAHNFCAEINWKNHKNIADKRNASCKNSIVIKAAKKSYKRIGNIYSDMSVCSHVCQNCRHNAQSKHHGNSVSS